MIDYILNVAVGISAGVAALVSELRRAAEGRRAAIFRLSINAVGAIATGAALAIILAAKFIEGAWITVLALPILLTLFRAVHHHYRKLARATAARRPLDLSNNDQPVALVPTKKWDLLTSKSLRFGMWLSPDLIAVHVTNQMGDKAAEEKKQLTIQWEKEVQEPARARGVPAPRLLVVQSPYRDVVRPVLDQIEGLKSQYPGRTIAIVVPEIVEKHWWQTFLHRRKAAALRNALRKRGDNGVVVVNVPWYMEG